MLCVVLKVKGPLAMEPAGGRVCILPWSLREEQSTAHTCVFDF